MTVFTGATSCGRRGERVRVNRGAAGVDRVTLAYVQEVYGVQRLRAELQADLREGTYRPAPARRVEIPKSDGGKRPLGDPDGTRKLPGRAGIVRFRNRSSR